MKLAVASITPRRGFARFPALLLGLSGLVTGAFGQSFAPPLIYASGGVRPWSVALGDVNGDGRLDAVVANTSSSTVCVLLGVAGDTFGAPTTYDTGSGSVGALGVVLGDVNGDGRLDAVVTKNSTVGVLLGQAGGTFAVAQEYAAPHNPGNVVLGDLNGDGRLDIVTANEGWGTVGVLLGRAGGTFARQVNYTTGGSQPYDVALGDVNGDGRLDAVVANSFSHTVAVLPGQAGGTFGAPTAYATGGRWPLGIKLGDVNGDGRLDIVTANGMTYDVGVLLGQAGGTFAPASTYTTVVSPSGVALGDLDGDGLLDIATPNPTFGTSTVTVLLGRAGGTFGSPAAYVTGGREHYAAAMGDVNADGRTDLVVANYGGNTVSILLNTGALLAATPAAAPPDVALYPNPAHDGFVVEMPADMASGPVIQAVLLNPLGQAVRGGTAALPGGTRLNMETSGLAAGVYTLRLRTGEGTVVKRVVIQ